MYISNQHLKIDSVMDTYLWHCKLYNVNENRINRSTKERILDIDDCESLPTCESYLLKNITRSSFTRKSDWADDGLDLVYSDVCGPINIDARGVYYYFIIFIDDLSRYGYIYFMQHKSKSFEMFKRFRNEVEK